MKSTEDSWPVLMAQLQSRPRRRVGVIVDLRGWGARIFDVATSQRGNAAVELLGVGLVLLVPLVYLVLTVGQLQAGAYASEAGAREAARIVARGSEAEDRSLGVVGQQAERVVEMAFADQGIEVNAGEVLTIHCHGDPCLQPGARVTVEVVADIQLPLVPDFVQSAVPAHVSVSAAHEAVIDRFTE